MSTPAMSRTQSPGFASGSGTSTPRSVSETSGYLLLTIQHAIVKQELEDEHMVLAQGELRLECISLPIPAEIGKQSANPFAPSPSDPAVPTHDFWLVLNVSTFEAPLIPTQKWTPRAKSLEGISYSFASQTIPGAEIVVTLPLPASSADLEDLDSLEVLLRQYGTLGAEATALADIEAPHMGTINAQNEDLRGRLVLINEDNGEIIGELDQRLDVVEEKAIAQGGKDKPVMLDFGGEVDGYAPQVVVKTVPEDEMDDWILKGAHHISKGILGFSSWSTKTMQTGADMFIRNTKAAEKPVHFSPRTKNGIRMTHNASVKTVKVAKTTLGKINDALSVVAEKAYTTTVEPAVEFYHLKDSPSRKSFSSDKKPGPPLPPRASLSNASGSPLAQSSNPPPPAPGQSAPVASVSPISPANANKPPVPPKPSNTAVDTTLAPPGEKTPLRSSSPQNPPSAVTATGRPNAAAAPGSPATPASAAKKRPFLNRLLLAGEVVLTSVEATVNDLISNGTTAASSAAGHKFGPEAGQATALLGGSVRNVAVVYVDVRGIGRKALLTGTAKGFVKARLQSGETVQIQAGGVGGPGGDGVEVGEVERGEKGTLIVGMPQVGRSPSYNAANPGAGQGSATVGRPQGASAQAQGYSTVDKETLDMLERMK